MVGEVLKIYQKSKQPNQKKKMAKELNREFSREEIQIIINIFKKCSTPSASHQANANQNYFESLSHAHQSGYH